MASLKIKSALLRSARGKAAVEALEYSQSCTKAAEKYDPNGEKMFQNILGTLAPSV